MDSRRERLVTWAVVASTACAMLLTTIRVRERLFASAPASKAAPKIIPDWSQYGGRQGNRMGPQVAPVTIVEFSDFLCSYCQEQAPVLQSIRERFPNEVAVTYRHYPSHVKQFARPAAIASECAARVGAFEAFHNLLFAKWDSIGKKPWTSFAREVGVADTSQFVRCMREPSIAGRVDHDTAAAHRLGVIVTPTLLINDVLVPGYSDTESVTRYVQAALRVKRQER